MYIQPEQTLLWDGTYCNKTERNAADNDCIIRICDEPI